MTNAFMIGLLLIIMVPVGLMITFIPFITRKTESFGVSIEEQYYNDAEIKQMRTTYAWMTGMLTLLLTGLGIGLAVSLDERSMGWVLPSVIFAIIIIQMFIYLRFHFRMKRLKEQRGLVSAKVQRIVVDTSFHREKRALSNAWFIPHFIVTVITAWICIYYYPEFPEQIVMQTDFSGNPTNVVDKTYFTVLWPVLMQLFMILIFWIVNYSIASSKQQVNAANPKKSLQQNLIFRRKWSGAMIFIGFLMTILFTLITLQTILQFNWMVMMGVIFGFVAITLIASIYLSFKMGQGGSRIVIDGECEPTGEVNRDDDEYWKLGMFYFNPKDPALFLEKRFGVGWSINYAKPLAWLIILGPIILSLLFVWLL